MNRLSEINKGLRSDIVFWIWNEAIRWIIHRTSAENSK